MPEVDEDKKHTLLKLFRVSSMQDLPAMSGHVQELISLLGNSQATAKDLAHAILKDYGLTTKVLQVVNSAYYQRNVPVATISRAVTVVGYTTLRELAVTIALFDEFTRAGNNSATALAQLTKNFISATQARLLVKGKKIRSVLPEEAFLGALFHQLGKVVTMVYLPAMYQAVEKEVAKGFSEERAARGILQNLTFADIGQQLAHNWNFSEQLIDCMLAEPPRPRSAADKRAMLQNLAVFNNRLTEAVTGGNRLDVEELLYTFGGILGIDQEEAMALVEQSISQAEEMSDPIRRGLAGLRVREHLITVTKQPDGNWQRIS